MAKNQDVFVFIGSYSSVDDAQMDYTAVKQLYSDGVIDTYDAAVINKDADGNVHVEKHEKATQKGAWTGVAVGAVVEILFPPSLIASAAVGGVVGHLHTRKFVNEWGNGENSFADDPPNAVVSFLEEGDAAPEEVTIELSDPHLTENTLTYNFKVLDGTIPAKAGPCSLFIDPIGRPLSPVSVMGVRRRQRRRMR